MELPQGEIDYRRMLAERKAKEDLLNEAEDIAEQRSSLFQQWKEAR